jgi:hypothetical protein
MSAACKQRTLEMRGVELTTRKALHREEEQHMMNWSLINMAQGATFQ